MSVSDRDERVEEYAELDCWTQAEKIVDLEDLNEVLRHQILFANIHLSNQQLDPSRLESALRMYIADLDYDIHKMLESPEDGGPDQYPNEVDYFIRCWETAGEGN
ncbi:hypothetical protein SEA_IBANTIK_9 [Streptomyces phage Ibantik]|uniref:Uncharacterized protein n=1 Tax=Streptomyces phage Ibantik TaxID=2182397 RepID=A0A2U8UNB4_9CAUD|nr:hypothetical protein QEH36_gp009 [Streptomyces phage Ibantik]AWN05234.1 hypothetical protein SEA_IBANTIK_9 [Streptomyces phage Ibantik]